MPGSATVIAVVPVEPGDVLALPRRRRRIGVVGVDAVAQVEVGVTTRAGVDVDVDQLGLVAGEAGREPGLLRRLPHGGVPRRLARVDVPARLDPDAERLVPVQQRCRAARRRSPTR